MVPLGVLCGYKLLRQARVILTRVIILIIGTVPNRAPPIFARLIPFHGFAHRVIEGMARRVAQTFDFVEIERVTPVVSGAVFDVFDQTFVFAGQLQNARDDFLIETFVAAADVVSLPRLALSPAIRIPKA